MIDAPHPIDLHVGEALRARRKLLGITQQRLAERIGVSFQQLQKYERGTNRISASMLARVAEGLEAAPGDFFPAAEKHPDPAGAMLRTFVAHGGADIARLYVAIDPMHRGALCRVAEALAQVSAIDGAPRHAAE